MKITWTEVIEFVTYKGWLQEFKNENLPSENSCDINVTN
jgi:hypothetical protein